MSVQPVITKPTELTWPRFTGIKRVRWQFSSILLLCAGLVVGALMLLPPVYLLMRTVGAGEAAVDILLKPSTIATIGRTLWLAVSVTVTSALIAIPLAWLTVCTDLPGRRVWAVAAALPLVLPSYVAAYLLASTLGPKGLFQQLLEPLTGIERFPEIYGFPGAFMVLTLMSYPYTFLTVRAAFKRLDPSLLEAARSLGLSPWRAFWRVTLPHLRPSVVAGSLLVMLYVMRDFGAVTMMRYNTFTRMIYIQYRSFTNRSLAAALAMVLIVMTAVILVLEMRTRGKAQYARRSVGSARQPKLVRLGAWRWPALLFVSFIVFMALIAPAGSLIYWLVRGYMRGQISMSLWQPAWNSFLVSLGAALMTIIAAMPVAILSVRRPGRFSQILERITYAGFALPGIVIALALVFFGANYARSLYQTLPMLVGAYVILFLPQAVGAVRSSLLQVPPSLEEAGRSLGSSPGQVFRRITLPLLQPGVLAGAGLVFLTGMKELPATLILSPTGFRTLATAVWGNIAEAFFAQAALPALLLILLSSIPLAILTLRDK
ncbi:MAG: iron ABC transporter permease [Chloroflexi bacterium]|nr:MAG: iron ABC transporter permease [Chloroflexota bacterium]